MLRFLKRQANPIVAYGNIIPNFDVFVDHLKQLSKKIIICIIFENDIQFID